jgi:hypothetical protein
MDEEQIRPLVSKLVDDKLKAFFGFNDMPCDGGDLQKFSRIAATVDSAIYVQNNMADKPVFGSRELLTYALEQAKVSGLILEFGVFSGSTINHIASLTEQNVFGFDSFEGLPEDWRPDIPKGAFATSLPEVRPNVRLVKGYFDDSLPNFLNTYTDCISFMHVDCDLYSSTKIIFDLCGRRLKNGTIIVFDEYFNYVGWRDHEYKAFHEFISSQNIEYEYIGYVPYHQQVAVRIL